MTDELELKDLITIIFKNRKLIIGITLGCFIVAGVISFILSPVYQSSLILEIGRIYLSPQPGILEARYIEDPDAVSKILIGPGVLDEVRRELNLAVRLQKLKDWIDVTSYTEVNKDPLPVLEILCRGKSPRQTVEIINTLAGVIIKRHLTKYRSYQQTLEERIAFNRDKIAGIRKIIAAQNRTQAVAQRYIERGEASADEFSRELRKLDTAAPDAVDMLYLQGTALTEKQNITALTEFKSKIDIEIGRDLKEVADTEMEIVSLKNLKEFSTPTRIVSTAVLPEKPISPKKLLMMIIAGFLGFAGSILYIFFREYLQE